MALFVSSPLASGDRLYAAPEMVRIAASRSANGAAPNSLTRSSPDAFPRQDRFAHRSSFQGNVGRRASETSPCRRAGNAKRRAQPPQSNGGQPGRRRGNRDPRALGVAWPLPRRLQLVFTRSLGRNSLFARCPIDVEAIEDGLLRVRCSVLRSPAWGPIQPWVGSDVCRSETTRSSLTRRSRRLRSS